MIHPLIEACRTCVMRTGVSYTEATEILESLDRRLAPVLRAADALRDFIVDEGLHYDACALEDCQGDKCRLPQCIACFGEEAKDCKETRSVIGAEVYMYDAAARAGRGRG